jgi:hypothetical protein
MNDEETKDGVMKYEETRDEETRNEETRDEDEGSYQLVRGPL